MSNETKAIHPNDAAASLADQAKVLVALMRGGISYGQAIYRCREIAVADVPAFLRLIRFGIPIQNAQHLVALPNECAAILAEIEATEPTADVPPVGPSGTGEINIILDGAVIRPAEGPTGVMLC